MEVRKDSGDGAARACAPAGKREERVLDILEEARLLFAQEGYAGFSVRTLARRVGIPGGERLRRRESLTVEQRSWRPQFPPVSFLDFS